MQLPKPWEEIWNIHAPNWSNHCDQTFSARFILFWLKGMWDHNSLTQNWTCVPFIGRWNLNLSWRAKEVLRNFNDSWLRLSPFPCQLPQPHFSQVVVGTLEFYWGEECGDEFSLDLVRRMHVCVTTSWPVKNGFQEPQITHCVMCWTLWPHRPQDPNVVGKLLWAPHTASVWEWEEKDLFARSEAKR